MFKKATVAMLATNQKAHIFMNAVNKKLLLDMESELHRVLPSGKYQHLYFLSDDEIKEGDWIRDSIGIIRQADSADINAQYPKVAATTNTSLLNLQAPPFT